MSRIGVERTIPIRFVELTPDCTALCNSSLVCPGDTGCATSTACATPLLDLALLQQHTQSLNQTYSVAGIQFTVPSVERYAMPGIAYAELFNQASTYDWTRVRSGLRQAFPAMSCTPPNLPGVSLTLREWVVWASAYFAPTSSIPAWTWDGFLNGFGVYPWSGRSIIWKADILKTTYPTNFAHEIGHFLGLPHAFDSAIIYDTGSYGEVDYDLVRNYLRDPTTGNYLGYSDFWDLVYKPVSGASNDVYYNTRAAIPPADESLLTAKEKVSRPTAPADTCSLNSPTCTLTCLMDDGNISTGDSRMVDMSYVYQGDNPAGGVYKRGVNVMGYQNASAGDNCQPGSLSGSQILQIRKTLRYDIDIEDKKIPSTTGKRPLLGQSTSAARPALYKLDFDNDGKRDAAVFEPPSTAGATGKFKALLSPAFTTTYNRDFGTLGDIPVPADYDGDGRTDFAVWRQFGPSGTDLTNPYAYWVYCPYLATASGTSSACPAAVSIQYGYNTDIPIPGTDFDGNPATGEIAVFRPSDGYVYWRYTTMAGGGSISTGGSGYGKIPLLDNYSFGPSTDVVLYDPSTAKFDIVYSANPTTHLAYQFPATLVAAGSGTTANRSGGVVSQGAYTNVSYCVSGSCYSHRVRVLQVWSPDLGTWYTYNPYYGLTGSPTTCNFGGPGDIPISGFIDKDGNGTSDFALYRAPGTDGNVDPPTTYFRHDDCTTDTATNVNLDLNSRSIVSASGDFNGDGQSDIVYLEKDTMTWTVLRSSVYTTTYYFQLGALGASPL